VLRHLQGTTTSIKVLHYGGGRVLSFQGCIVYIEGLIFFCKALLFKGY